MNPILKVLLTPIGPQSKPVVPPLVPVPAQRRPQRRFDRFRVPVPIIARVGRRHVLGTTASIGLGGLFITCDTPFATQTQVNLSLDGRHGQISARGKVVYSAGGGMGIRFTGLTTAESSQLKALFTKATKIPDLRDLRDLRSA